MLKKLIRVPVLIMLPAAALSAALIMGQSTAFAAPVKASHSARVSPGHVRMTRQRASRLPSSYRVRPGDTLTSIAKRAYGSRNRWPVLWWFNQKKITNPNVITAGETLRLNRWHPRKAWMTAMAIRQIPKPKPVTVVTASTSQGDSSSGGQAASPAPAGGSVSPGDYSGFQACVISRESGGDSQVMNSSGHYGLYQFSASTWDAAGGNPADFGHASVAEQNQVFANAFAKWGTSPWAPYDGC